MALSSLPTTITTKYEVHEYRHAISILQQDFPVEYAEIIGMLDSFTLKQSAILSAGGSKSPISSELDDYLYKLGWDEHQFNTILTIDGVHQVTPTHKIDCYKNRVALDIEWNNKDPFFDRDLNNFRLLHERGAISVGVIITRCDELQKLFVRLGKGTSYGASTTHMSKLLPRIAGGSAGGCPLLIFGISTASFDPTK